MSLFLSLFIPWEKMHKCRAKKLLTKIHHAQNKTQTSKSRKHEKQVETYYQTGSVNVSHIP